MPAIWGRRVISPGFLSPQDEVPQGHAGAHMKAETLLNLMEVAFITVNFFSKEPEVTLEHLLGGDRKPQ